MCNLHWRYTFCTELHFLHWCVSNTLERTALSQSESSNFFMCIINGEICRVNIYTGSTPENMVGLQNKKKFKPDNLEASYIDVLPHIQVLVPHCKHLFFLFQAHNLKVGDLTYK